MGSDSIDMGDDSVDMGYLVAVLHGVPDSIHQCCLQVIVYQCTHTHPPLLLTRELPGPASGQSVPFSADP